MIPNAIKHAINGALSVTGYRLARIGVENRDIKTDGGFEPIFRLARSYTMTSIERMYALYKSVRYVGENQIPGAIVECGAWKGGSCMVCALTLKQLGEMDRQIYIYDTFEGMPKPGPRDARLGGLGAERLWLSLANKGQRWCYACLEEVQKNLLRTGYPSDLLIFIKGKVEETLKQTVPPRIALLRLDTDWYESTYQELVALFPLVSEGGVIIIDDYGGWTGAKLAVDQYISENRITLLLNRIDHTGRIGIKGRVPLLAREVDDEAPAESQSNVYTRIPDVNTIMQPQKI